MNSPDDEWWDLQAGEYVIGTLPQDERTTFTKLLASDADVRRRVVWWETRLAHLDRDVAPVTPSDAVWQKIVERIRQPGDIESAPSTVVDITTANNRASDRASDRAREQQQSLSAWRGLAAVATAACMVLAITLWLHHFKPRGPDDNIVVSYDGISILSDDENQTLWVVDASSSDKELRVTVVAAPEKQAGKSYELWMVKANDQGVSSMGLLPLETAQSVVINTPDLGENGVAFAVSLEPLGGSPESVPTGPVLYSGPIQKLTLIDSI